MTRRPGKPHPVQGQAGPFAGCPPRSRSAAQMDGCPRQNPAYRPATRRAPRGARRIRRPVATDRSARPTSVHGLRTRPPRAGGVCSRATPTSRSIMASTTTRRPRTTIPSTRTAHGRARPSDRASRGTTAQPGAIRGTAQRATTIARGRRKQEPTGLKGVVAKVSDAIPGVTGAGKRSKSSSKNPMSGIVDALPFGGAREAREVIVLQLRQARGRRRARGRRSRAGHQEPRQDHLDDEARRPSARPTRRRPAAPPRRPIPVPRTRPCRGWT